MCRSGYYVSAPPERVRPEPNCRSGCQVADPVDPATGLMFREELDYKTADGRLGIKRFYNSHGDFWGDRRWTIEYSKRVEVRTFFNGGEGAVFHSTAFDTASDACVQGWPQVANDNAEFGGVTASYVDGRCMLSDGSAAVILHTDSDALSGISDAGRIVDVKRDNGDYFKFYCSEGICLSYGGGRGRLFIKEDGFLYLTERDEKEFYDAEGRLLRIDYRDGYSKSMEYGDDGLIVSVVDSYGRKIYFFYDGGRINKIRYPSGVESFYNYDNYGKLESVKNIDGSSYIYRYDDPADLYLLTGIINEEDGWRVSWEYDEFGRVVRNYLGEGGGYHIEYGEGGAASVTDPLGARYDYEFQNVGGRWKPKKINLHVGGGIVLEKMFSYDENGFVDSVSDFDGTIRVYEYNSRGLVVDEVESKGGVDVRHKTYDWHDEYSLPVKMVQSGRYIELSYDADGNLVRRKIVDEKTGEERVDTFSYSAFGLLKERDGPRVDVNDVYSYEYDEMGRLLSVSNGLSQVREVGSYNGRGDPKRIVGVNGVEVNLSYDEYGRVTERSIENSIEKFLYNGAGQVREVYAPSGSRLNFHYNEAGYLTAVMNSGGQQIRYLLDDAGNHKSKQVLDPEGIIIKKHMKEYDLLGRVIVEINGVGARKEYGYNSAGDRVVSTDALGRVTNYKYDSLDRLVETTNAINGVASYEYDALDNLTKVIDPRGVSTTYEYNAFGDVIAEHSPDAGATTYTYDAAGNRATRTDARGVTASYSYDALNRLTAIDYPGTEEDVTYVYDQGVYGKGQLTGFSDASGSTTMTYDPRGNVLTRIHTSTAGPSFTTKYEYDLADNLTALVYPSGLRIDLTRDTMGRVTSVEATIDGEGSQLASQIQYQPFGGITGLTYGNGLTEVRQYDLAGRLTSRSAMPIQDLDWAYDLVGNITEIQDGVIPARTQTFDYDALDRLTGASGAYGVRAYEYDAVGNRTRLTKDSQQTTYGYAPDSNRLTDIDGQTVPYDAIGNMLALAGDTFTYGARNRRQTTERNQSLIAEYEYNALGQRSYKNHAGAETHFVYGQGGQLIGEYDASGQVIREYVYLAGEPMALVRQGEVYYFHNDQLGSPLKLTDGNQDVVWDGIRSPFGEVDVQVNTESNPLRFPGQYFDQEIGLHQNWFRDYDPSLGRYLQSDPIGILRDYSDPQLQVAISMGTLEETGSAGEVLNHVYGYVGQNPLYWIDPYGLAKGGNQNQRSSEFDGMSDADVSKQARDPNVSKEDRRKAQKEEKARKQRNKTKRNKGKGKGGKFGGGLFGIPCLTTADCFCIQHPDQCCELYPDKCGNDCDSW
ncbi:RHS repeat-associated core domain-containing protein [Alloalcanivorax sp. C16-2]|uniref:RHS repeat-associated core domain-containing protein n=1 Tax=Alloalcanivorax sp. C16-2 TaxID=3390052 RepID=UPI003970B39B